MAKKAAAKKQEEEFAYAVGDEVRFTGFTAESEDEYPDNHELLEEGEVYEVVKVIPPEEDDEEPSFALQVDNPDFDDSKKASKKNPQTLTVEVFADEVEVSDEEAEEEADEEEVTEESEVEDIDVADIEKGMTVVLAIKGQDDEVDGEVEKVTKTSLTVGGVKVTKSKIEDASRVLEIEEEEDAGEEEVEEAEEEAPKQKASAKGKAKGKAAEKGSSKLKGKGATKGKGKGKSKPSAATPKDEVDQEIRDLVILQEEEDDPEVLELIAGAEDINELARETAQETSHLEYRLGGIIYHIRVEKTYKELDESYAEKGGFEKYCNEVLGLEYRKAMWLSQIYSQFRRFGVEGDVVAEIGWTRSKEIARVMDEDNTEELVELARSNTVRDLQDTIKESYDKKGGKTGELVKKISFKFRLAEDAGQHVREILEQAKKQMDAKKDEEVFEHIFTEWAHTNLEVSATRKAKAAGKAKAGTKAKAGSKRRAAATA